MVSSNRLETMISDMIRFIEKRGGEVTINDLFEWINKFNAGELVLYTLIRRAKKMGLIETHGVWRSKSISFFYIFPLKIRLVKTPTMEKEHPFVTDKIDRVKKYLGKYFSVGDVRIKEDLREISESEWPQIIKRLEEEGYIIYNREYGVITATEKLLEKYSPKLHDYL